MKLSTFLDTLARSYAGRQEQANQRLAIAMNSAANGRVFCAVLAALNAYGGHSVLAFLAALPIGLASLVDMLPDDRGRPQASALIYLFAALIAVLSFVNAW